MQLDFRDVKAKIEKMPRHLQRDKWQRTAASNCPSSRVCVALSPNSGVLCTRAVSATPLSGHAGRGDETELGVKA
jgi:hypothetical protein